MSNKTKIRIKMVILRLLILVTMFSVIGFALFAILTATGYGVNRYDETASLNATYFILTIVCLAFIPISVFLFKTLYKNLFVVEVLNVELPGCYYSRHNGFGQGLIDVNIGLVEPGNKYKSEDYISGTYEGIHFEQADVIINNEVREEKAFSDETSVKVYKHFRGRMIVMDSPVNVKKPVYLYSYEFEHRYKNQYMKLTSEEINDKVFGDVFDILVTEKGSAKKILDYKMKRALLTTYNKFYNMAVRFEDKKMYIAINTKEDSFDWKVSRGMNFRKEVEANRNQIYVIKDIIDILKGKDERLEIAEEQITQIEV